MSDFDPPPNGIRIVAVPIDCHFSMGATSSSIAEISRPFIVPVVDLPEASRDNNPLSQSGIQVSVRPDPACASCVESPWDYGNIPVVSIDLTSSTFTPFNPRTGESNSGILAGAFYAAMLTFAEDSDATVTLQLLGHDHLSSEWHPLFRNSVRHWRADEQRFTEGPLTIVGWQIQRQFNGTWHLLKAADLPHGWQPGTPPERRTYHFQPHSSHSLPDIP